MTGCGGIFNMWIQVDRAVVLKQSLAAALTAAALGAGVKGAVAAETTTKVVSKFKVSEEGSSQPMR